MHGINNTYTDVAESRAYYYKITQNNTRPTRRRYELMVSPFPCAVVQKLYSYVLSYVLSLGCTSDTAGLTLRGIHWCAFDASRQNN